MFIVNESGIIQNLAEAPDDVDRFWTLNMCKENGLDFMIERMRYIETFTTPALKIIVEGAALILPATWSILVCSSETHALDVVELHKLSGTDFELVVCGNRKVTARPTTYRVVDYFPEYESVTPFLNKSKMLCHPINDDEWIMTTAYDVYNRFIRGLLVGDLIH